MYTQAETEADDHAKSSNSIKMAFANFHMAAKRQQRRISTSSRFSRSMDKIRAKGLAVKQKFHGLKGWKYCRFITSIVFFVFFFMFLISVSMWCFVLGIKYYSRPCQKNLQLWLIIQALFGWFSIASIIMTVIAKYAPEENKFHIYAKNNDRLIAGILGLSVLCNMVVFLVGTAYVYSIDSDLVTEDETSICPSRVYDFCLYLNYACWSVALLLLLTACVFINCSKHQGKFFTRGGRSDTDTEISNELAALSSSTDINGENIITAGQQQKGMESEVDDITSMTLA